MNRYQLSLPLPKDGINLIDDSLISDTEAAEGTKNISFKNGIPQTRKGYVKANGYHFTALPKTLLDWVTNGVHSFMAACGTKVKKQSGNTFVEITGSVSNDIIEALIYPCSIGYANKPDNLVAVKTTGTLAIGKYYYRVTAVTTTGETDPSDEVMCELTSQGGVIITWAKVDKATGYKVFGRSQAGELHMSTLGNVLTWTDDGSITPSGAMPTSNTTAGSYSDKLFVVDGTTYQYYDESHGGLNVVIPRSPSSNDKAYYGDNVLITVPDEINKQKFILNDNERIWLAGYGKIVRMSGLQMPDYWPSTHVWKLEEDCTGMAHFMDEVLLFTENTVTLISGSTPDWSLAEKYVYKKLPGGYGCNAHRSIAQGDNAVYWANKNGVYRYRYLPSGYSIPECVSEFVCADGHTRTVKKWLSNIYDWSSVHAQFYDHEYRLYIGDCKVICFDTILSTWTIYEYNKPFACSTVYDKKLYYAHDYLYNIDYTYDPYVAGYDGLNDFNSAIEFRIKSKYYDFSKAANKKKFKKLYVSLYSEFISYTIDAIFNIDNELQTIKGEIVNNISKFGEMKYGDVIKTNQTNLNFPLRIHHKGKKYNIQYELVCSGLNMAWLVKEIVLLLKIKELK